MKPGKRFGLSAAQKSEMWCRWKAGDSLHANSGGPSAKNIRPFVVWSPRHAGGVGLLYLSLAPGLKPDNFAYNPDHPRRSQEA
jgi:hypothetical protein